MKTYEVMSFGAGVQTTAMAVLACTGRLPKPDFAVFADPQNESRLTYDYLVPFKQWMMDRGVRLVTSSRGNIIEDTLKANEGRIDNMPFFVAGVDGKAAPIMRQCTNAYKVMEVRRAIRKELGANFGVNVILWLGISLDEAHRMKESTIGWIKNKYPLIDLRLTRDDCERVIREAGLAVPPKSACIVCPYHSNDFWLDMKKSRPDEWAMACKFDEDMRTRFGSRMRGEVFLHRSLKPLSDAPIGEDAPSLFGEECEGHCGL